MITKTVEIPITKESYPFASAQRYLNISARGYVEREYYVEGTSNVYQTMDDGSIGVKNENVPYVNRIIVRAPKAVEKFSGNVVVEIINATSLMEIDRMWILGYREFMRSGDIYVGITSKHATFAKLKEFNQERYSRLSWPNPTPEVPFPFTMEELRKSDNILMDQDINCEPGLFWDMLTDLGLLLKTNEDKNPLKEYKPKRVVLTGWSQSGGYMIRYINDFVYKAHPQGGVYDGFMIAGPPRHFTVPVNQYEILKMPKTSDFSVHYLKEPTIIMQTECECGHMGTYLVRRNEGDSSDFLCRQYDVTGASHDTLDSYVDYYKNDSDLIRINHLPEYVGKDEVANNYPTHFLVDAMYRNLFRWIETSVAPATCKLIEMDANGENRKDALGITKGGLRTCFLDYPTAAYYNVSDIERGANPIFPDLDKEILFGHEEPYPKEMLKAMYGSLEHYRELITEHTKAQINKGFIVKEDMDELIAMAMRLARERGLD